MSRHDSPGAAGASPSPAETGAPAASTARARRERLVPAANTARSRREWLIPAALILLALVPTLAGGLRLADLASGAPATPENVRFVSAPIPVVVHILASVPFLVLGALQFAPSLRRRPWHRRVGRVLAPAGILSALTGMWMGALTDLPEPSGVALVVLRLGFGSLMVAGVVVAVVAIRRGDVRTHSAWMTRSYAIGAGAGTQVLTTLPYVLAFGDPGEAANAVLMGAGWVINLAVAEVVIRRRAARGTRSEVERGKPSAVDGANHSGVDRAKPWAADWARPSAADRAKPSAADRARPSAADGSGPSEAAGAHLS